MKAMSNEQLAALLAKLKDDAGLQDRLQGAGDLDTAVAIAKEAGFDVTKADWFRHQAGKVLELSDEELEGVAGAKYDTGDTKGCAWNTALHGCFNSLNICC